MAKKKNSTYDVLVNVRVETSITVAADSYEEALAKARDLKVKDVVELDTDFNDGDIAIVGVFNNNEEKHG